MRFHWLIISFLTMLLWSFFSLVQPGLAATNASLKAAKSTPTPQIVYTPADPSTINTIIGFAVISVVIVLFGIWLNRNRLS